MPDADIWKARTQIARTSFGYNGLMLKGLFQRFKSADASAHAVPPGIRLYAVGDIHGRLDLLDRLLRQIDVDDAGREPAETRLIFLGDLPDRGAESRGVIERLMDLSRTRPDTVFLKGNHEELMIRTWEGERGYAPTFHRAGGRATMLSYGVSPETYDSWAFDDLVREMERHVPSEHIAFLRSFRDSFRVGEYLFVHAGIRPGISLADQDPLDLRWIREDFTESRANFGVMVVHGHTIKEEVDVRANRIGIDTGAFRTNRLTAIGLESADRWFLST